MKNIIWLVSYPKSGNTWFRMFLSNYINHSDIHIELDDIISSYNSGSAIDFENKIGLNPFELTQDEVDLYRPDLYRILSKERMKSINYNYKKTHDAYTMNLNGIAIFPEDVSKCAVYFVRNPLDVCISYANHSTKEINNIIRRINSENAKIAGEKNDQIRQLLLSWKSHVKSWTSQNAIPLHLVRYEDMIQNPTETFGSIIKFIGLDYNEARLIQAINHSDFKLLKEMEVANGFSERLQQCKSFFWKGTVGNYRNYLTEEQITTIVDYSRDVMLEHGYIDNKGQLTV